MAMKKRNRQTSRSKPCDRENPGRICKEDEKSGENVCPGRACSCAASFTADCAAICCCPCALLHLLFLAFVRLPATLATKAFCYVLRNRKKSAPDNIGNSCTAEPGRPTPPCSCRESPEPSARMPPFEESQGAKFDTEKVWSELYAAGHMGFGGLPLVPGD